MKRRLSTQVIPALLIALFVYAAVSKWLDWREFQIQLGQSPLLAGFSGVLALLVPIVEIGLALCLAFPAYQVIGLYGSFCLMLMFSIYIFLITRFTDYVPCSCGGVLQKMSWEQHLFFNIGFVGLTVISILFYQRADSSLPGLPVTTGTV